MFNPLLFVIQIALLIAIGAVHAYALSADLYWFFPLLNRAVHFAGGVWVALGTMWLFSYLMRKYSFFTIITLVLLVSVAWEIFEVAIGMTSEVNYFFDTSLDLVMDFCGGVVGYFMARLLIPRDIISSNESA